MLSVLSIHIHWKKVDKIHVFITYLRKPRVQIIDLTLGFDLDLGLWLLENGLDTDNGN